MKQFLLFTITFYLAIVQCINFSIAARIDTTYEWKYIEFDWDSDEDKQAAIDDGSYVQGASIPVDVDRYDKNGDITVTFITIIRKPGVPASLTTITDKKGEGGPLLRPYPDWSATKDCSGYTNTHKVAINRCGQLWILDSGKIDDDQVCPPKITIIDLKTDEKINEIEVPQELIKGEVINIVVQPLDESCKKSAAYIADSIGNVLIIYDGEKFCSLEGSEFESTGPEAEEFNIGNDKNHHEYGVYGLSLTTPEDGPDDQELYFRALASFDLYHVNTEELRDYCKTGNKPQLIKLRGTLSSQSVGQVIDSNGVLFYSSVQGTSVHCWSTFEVFRNGNMVTLDRDVEKYQWISSMKISPPEQESTTLLMISNRYQKYVNEDLNDNDVNFRVLQTDSYLVVFGTECSG